MRIKLKPKRDNDFRQMWFVGSYQVLGRRSRDFTFINTAWTGWFTRRSSDNLTQLRVVFIKYMSHLMLYYIYCILNMIHLSGRPKDSHRCAECDAIEMFVLWNLITHTHTHRPIRAGCAGKSLCGGCNLVTTVWECTEVELNKTRFTTTHTHTHCGD